MTEKKRKVILLIMSLVFYLLAMVILTTVYGPWLPVGLFLWMFAHNLEGQTK